MRGLHDANFVHPGGGEVAPWVVALSHEQVLSGPCVDIALRPREWVKESDRDGQETKIYGSAEKHLGAGERGMDCHERANGPRKTQSGGSLFPYDCVCWLLWVR